MRPSDAGNSESGRDRALWAQSGDVRLAGQMWLPSGRPRVALVMVPGSGPSDRHNDVFFPPIREHLLENGIAVASFDKRGVGDSTGDWLTAGIVEQADDALAALDTVRHREELTGVPVGVYGHSQGGWVVLEAAGRDPEIAFVVTNSGPGVSPADQERHAAAHGLQRAGRSPSDIEAGLADYEAMLTLLRDGASYDDFQRTMEGDDDRRERLVWLRQAAFVPDGPGLWNFARRTIDYDPRPVMRRIESPVLALFGAEDRVVPVATSVRTYRDVVADIAVHVFAEADHRCQLGDPPTMAPGYLDTLTEWLLQHSGGAERGRS